jgi:uncharacterized protein
MKDKIISAIANCLEQEESIIFAYFFGSFPKEESYSDIDIGIYLKSEPAHPYTVTSELKSLISRKLQEQGIPFIADKIDIVIINLLPFTFVHRIFREGRLILDRNPELRAELMEHNCIKMRECLGIIKEAEIL